VRQDLEGIVAKRRDGMYNPDAPTRVKIKNPDYSQAAGRHEPFDRRRSARPAPGRGPQGVALRPPFWCPSASPACFSNFLGH